MELTGRTHKAETDGYLQAVACPTSNNCFAVGSGGGGLILVTSNGGSNWNSWTTTAYRNLRGISCLSRSTCIAVGDQGAILVTDDGGASWHSQPVTATSLQGITCLTSTGCVAVGAQGTTLTTGHAGAAPVPSPTQPVRQMCPQGQGTGTRVMPVYPTLGTRLPLAAPVTFSWKPFCQATNYVLQLWIVGRQVGPALGSSSHVTFTTMVYHHTSYVWNPAGLLAGSYAYSLIPLDELGNALAAPSTPVTFTLR